MEEETAVNLQLVLQLKFIDAGKELIKLLKVMLTEDVVKLSTQVDGNDAASVGMVQGQLIRTQAIVHLLEAEEVITDEEDEEVTN